jgi:hypothetical protein
MDCEHYKIVAIMPADGWTAAICSFDEGVPTVVDAPVVALAVVRYEENDSDVVEPCVWCETGIIMPESYLRQVLWEELFDGLAVSPPAETLDKKSLIDSTRMRMTISLMDYAHFDEHCCGATTDMVVREDFAAHGWGTLEEWVKIQRRALVRQIYGARKTAELAVAVEPTAPATAGGSQS